MAKKYKLTNKKKEIFGTTLYQIKALVSFGDVKAGELGGFIESKKNLSQEGTAWVSGDALVSGDAWVNGRFDLTVPIDFELKRIKIDSKEKLLKLKKFLDEFDSPKKGASGNSQK